MATSIQSARAEVPAAAAPAAQGEAAFARGRWVPVAWAIVVLVCLAFWVGLVGLLVTLS